MGVAAVLRHPRVVSMTRERALQIVAELTAMRVRMLELRAELPSDDLPHDHLGYASRYLRDAYTWLASENEVDDEND
jgi:hypothetical protein